MGESPTSTTWFELTTSSYPARTRKNIEESDGTVIFSLERLLNGGTKLTRDYANKLGKPLLHIYDTRKERIFNPDFHRLEIQGLANFLCSNKIEILNVAGPRESKEPGVYKWTFSMLRCFRAHNRLPWAQIGCVIIKPVATTNPGANRRAVGLHNRANVSIVTAQQGAPQFSGGPESLRA
jgi:Circularly permutated YpsA SLOG family